MKQTTTKSALLTSAMALLLCFAMLLGTTFAWFTDTASTAVNKIQAGNLDVQLLDAIGNSLEGKTLTWEKAAGHTAETVLWEPGCTYNLTSFKIRNNGDLALKYKIAITGIVGDAELLNAIEFTVTGVTGATTATALNGFEGRLAPNSETSLITITGKMRTEAGNEYQGKSIDNIGITVLATQLGGTYAEGPNGENDSFNNEYDKEATYPPLATYINNTSSQPVTLDNAGMTNASAATVISDTVATSTIPAGTPVYSDDNNTLVATDDSGKLNREIKTTAATADSVTYDISYNYVNSTGTSTPVVKFGNIVENIIPVSTGLTGVTVTHTHGTTTTAMNMLNAIPSNITDNTAYYDSANGKIYVWSSAYSSFKIEYKSDFAAATGGQGYATLKEAFAAAEDGALITVLKSVAEEGIEVATDKSVTLNLADYTITGVTDEEDTAVITNNGTLTINANNGGIAAKAIAVLNKGTLNVNGGTYSNHGQAENSGSYIFDTQAGTTTIDGVTITEVFKGIRAKNAGATVIVKNSTADVEPGYGLFATAKGGSLTVESGTYKTTYSEARQMFDLKGSSTITVTGGSFETAYTSVGIAPAMVVFNSNGNTFKIEGGTFTTAGNLIFSHYNNDNTVTITGGTFSSDPSAYVAIGYETKENGGRFEVDAKVYNFPCGAKTELNAQIPGGATVITTQDALNAALAAVTAEGAKLYIGEGDFSINTVNCDGKDIVFVGAGYNKTTLRYGSNPSNPGGEGGSNYCFEGSEVTFRDVTLIDGNGDDVNYKGFVRCAGLTFDNCVLKSRMTYLGENGGVSFKNCTFETPKYAAWIYSSQTYNFANCLFQSPTGRFLNIYSESNIAPVINATECKFIDSSDGSDSNAVFNIKSTAKTTLTIKDCVVSGASPMYKVAGNNGTLVTIDGRVVYGTTTN